MTRAYTVMVIRALRLEAENRALYAALAGDRTALILALRERGVFWREIGARLGVRGETLRRAARKGR